MNSEPSVRDVLLALTGVSAGFAHIVVYTVGLWFDWRTVALLSSSIPITALIALLFVSRVILTLRYSKLILHYLFQGSRDSNLASISAPRWGSLKIVAMAARMGIRESYRKRIKWPQRIPWFCKLLQEMPSNKNRMQSSSTNTLGQNQRTISRILCETDDNCGRFRIFLQLHWGQSLKSVSCTNIEYVWNTDKPGRFNSKKYLYVAFS